MVKNRENRSHRPADGFTLLELIVSMVILVAVLVGVLALFDTNNKVSRVQTNLADLQQSQRIAQHELVRNVRMAARGGIPTRLAGLRPLPAGMAIEVRNNVGLDGSNPNLDPADTGSPLIVPETDVLTVRGMFESPVYSVNPTAGLLNINPGTTAGSIIIPVKTTTGILQDLSPLETLLNELSADGNRREALLLISPLDDVIFAVVELDPTASSISLTIPADPADNITLGFDISGGVYTAEYLNLTPGGAWPPALQSVAFVGILEEYKYYVRQISDSGAAGLSARLSRAQFYPGTNQPHAGNPGNLTADIADNIIDLQIALGIDIFGPTGPGSYSPDEAITEGTLVNPDPSATDEWLFNHSGDTDSNGNLVTGWNGGGDPWNFGNLEPHVYYLRINTLARTDRRDPTYTSPPLQSIEDHIYNQLVNPSPADLQKDRRYRRRLLQTVVDLRNIS